MELVLLKSRLVIRFKKLDKNGRSRNILTPAQRNWFEDQLRLPGALAPATRLVAGYVLDEIPANLCRIFVTMPDGPSPLMWRLELPEVGETKIIEIPHQRQEPRAPVVRSARRRSKGANNGGASGKEA